MALPLLPIALLALAPVQLGPEVVLGVQKISDRYGDFPTPLRNRDQLGRSVSVLGDLDQDGVVDLAVGAHGDDDGGTDRGAVHVLFLRADGTVKAATKISALAGGLVGPLDDGDQLGRALVGPGDVDGDGIPDLAVGASFDDDGGPNRGAVYLLFLNRDGTVRAESKLSSLAGGLVGLRDRDEFGRALAAPGDLDGDGTPDLVVAAPYDDAGGANKGALHLLWLTPAGTVREQAKISSRDGGFTGALRGNDLFGFSLAAPGDLDGDGHPDLVAGAVGDDDGGTNVGAVWVLFLGPDRRVRAQQKISALAGGFAGLLHAGDQLGNALAPAGDLDGDGRTEIAVGAWKDDEGGLDRGACWILSLNADGTVASQAKIAQLSGGFPLPLRNSDWFGSSLAALGDLDGDGSPDLALGARMDDDMGANRGAIYLAFLGQAAQALRGAGAERGPAASAGPPLRLLAGHARPGACLELALGASPRADARPLLWLVGPCGAPLAPRVTALEAGAEPRVTMRLPEGPDPDPAALELRLLWLAPDGRPLGPVLRLPLRP